MATSAPTAATSNSPASLLTALAGTGQRAAITFAGQGADALAELSALVAQRPARRAGLEVASAVLADAIASPEGQASGRFRHGADLVAWAEDPDGAPSGAYLRSTGVSCPLILVTQALLWQSLWEDGLDEAMRAGAIVATAGHSLGLLAALMVAEAGPRGIDDALLARYVRLAWALGVHAATCTQGGAQPPLAAVSGVRLKRLRPLVDEVNRDVAAGDAVSVALVNTPRRIVVGGPAARRSRGARGAAAARR
jgi:malonyl CoA-acyl carrier protein transacylase